MNQELKKKIIRLVIVLAVLAVIGIIIYFSVFKDKDSDDDTKIEDTTIEDKDSDDDTKIENNISSTGVSSSSTGLSSSSTGVGVSSTGLSSSSTGVGVGVSSTGLSSSSTNSKTVRERLDTTCQLDSTAGDKIAPNNGATRIDYLYSACTNANTCDSKGEPDEISKRIINMKKPQEHCGAWLLTQDPNQIQIVYDNGTKSWRRLTVKEILSNTCPIDPTAGDKIAPNNGARRNDYLYSACTNANTCDTTEPDEISKRIINMKKPQENCGAWLLTQDPNDIKIEFGRNGIMGWTKL